MKPITLFKSNLSDYRGKFLLWSPERSFRGRYCHVFKGVTTRRLYWSAFFLGFVTAGSIPWFHSARGAA